MSILYFTGNTLDWAGLLLIAACGFVLSRRAGLFNIGMEGQIYAGGFVASYLALSLQGRPAIFVLAAACLAALAAGGLMGAICGLCKRYCGAHELITSFLLSAFAAPVIDYLIGGPLRGPDGNLLAMARLPAELLSARILPPSKLNVFFIVSIAAPLILWRGLYFSATGYRLRLAGAAPDFARYGGIQPERYWIGSLAASGALAGLAGFMIVTGSSGICHQAFPAGLGWAAVATGLIARGKPPLLYPAALFYAVLKFSTSAALLGTGIDNAVFTLATGLVLFAATTHRED